MPPRSHRFDIPLRWRVLLVATGARKEFAQVLQLIHALADVTVVPNLDAAESFLSGGDAGPPAIEFVILIQSHPGQYAPKKIESLVRLSPLARWVIVAGSWCEGEMRTGGVSPLVEREYWYAWPAWCAQNLAPRHKRSLSQSPTSARTIETASPAQSWRLRDDRVADPTDGDLSAISGDRIPLAIRTWQRVDYQGLAEVAEKLGYVCEHIDPRKAVPPFEKWHALIWVLRYGEPREAAELASFTNSHLRLPIIVLATFPRVQDVDLLRQSGATQVLAQPMALADLARALQQVAPAALRPVVRRG